MFKWLKRGLWVLLGLLVTGSVYQTVMASRDASRYHPSGRMVDIGGGRRLNLDCRGTGSPTVILESGLGSPAILWDEVMKGVAPVARVCAYDRAGYGFSDAGPEPRTTNAIVDDLEKLLAAAGENGPYVLVGHSFGGFNIRVFTARHRAEVAGLVFVDSSHPEQTRRMSAGTKRKQDALNWLAQLAPLLCRVGVVRASMAWSGAPGELVFLQSQPKYGRAVVSELNAFPESGDQTRAASPTLGDLPVIVLTAGKDGLGDAAMWSLWRNELQPELVKLSSRSKQTVVEGATHLIPTEKPQAVVEAIREMLSGIQHP